MAQESKLQLIEILINPVQNDFCFQFAIPYAVQQSWIFTQDCSHQLSRIKTHQPADDCHPMPEGQNKESKPPA